jgi:hypothetical protein
MTSAKKNLMFTDAGIKEIAMVALERGNGARGLRAVVEEILEPVMFEAEARVRYVVTDKTIRDGEVLKQSMNQARAPLGSRVMRRLVSIRNRWFLTPGSLRWLPPSKSTLRPPVSGVAPALLFMNVERAYREFCNEPPDAPWDTAATFDAIYHVAKAKGIAVEF